MVAIGHENVVVFRLLFAPTNKKMINIFERKTKYVKMYVEFIANYLPRVSPLSAFPQLRPSLFQWHNETHMLIIECHSKHTKQKIEKQKWILDKNVRLAKIAATSAAESQQTQNGIDLYFNSLKFAGIGVFV